MSVIEAPAPSKTVVTTRDVLLRAAELLEEFGWLQGSLGSKAIGRMCAMGAVYQAADDFGCNRVRTLDAIVSLLPASYRTADCDLLPLARWNDAPGRTKAEVVARLRAAAEAAQ